jgi:hypothetical protein
MNHDKASYLMLFCSLMLVQKSAARLDEIIPLLPSAGPAKELAESILAPQQVV